MLRKLAAGNWKMNGDTSILDEVKALNAAHLTSNVDILLCPPATLLERLGNIAGPAISTGGQDCHSAEKGAHTGDISAQMLRDVGASFPRNQAAFYFCQVALMVMRESSKQRITNNQ